MQPQRSPSPIAVRGGSLALAGCLFDRPRQQEEAETPPPADSGTDNLPNDKPVTDSTKARAGHFGGDKSRRGAGYKGQDRQLFSDQAGFGTGYYLTWIIHNSNEAGYR
jgi:hypothetical protein